MDAFQNRVAAVTGGVHKIGKAIAEKFRREGACSYTYWREG